MNKRNIERKRIEQISPTISTGDQIQGNELFMVSARDTNSVNGYSTKKMGIQALKDYVLAGITGNNENEVIVISNGGYEIYRVSESNVGDYIYEESVSGSWTKTFNEDCEILMTPGVTPLGELSDSFIVKLDGIRLHTGLMSLGVDDKAQFYVKAGQTLTVEAGPSWYSAKLSARPLKCGGDFFIDSLGEFTEPFTSHARKDSTFTFTAPSKTLFIWAAGTATGTFSSVKLNNVDIGWKNQGTSIRYDRMVLDTGDTLTLTFGGGLYVKYCAYPLMDYSSSESEPDAIQLWENGPYWATKNIGAKRDIDFGEYFQYGSLNGYRYENNVFVGNDNDNFVFNDNNSVLYGKSKEQLLQDGIITEDDVLTPNYDAATQKFGSEWKIPSYNDWIALNSHCDMQWTRKNGVEGVMITGRNAYADKSIFLPNSEVASGNRPTGQMMYSSTKVSYGPTTTQAAIAECAYFTNSGQSAQVLVQDIRSVQDGLPIRPIKVVS